MLRSLIISTLSQLGHDKGVTLEDLFHQFEDLETNHMQTIRDMIEDRGKSIIREAEKGGR